MYFSASFGLIFPFSSRFGFGFLALLDDSADLADPPFDDYFDADSEGVTSALSRSNANHVFDGKHENLPVADASGFRRALNRIDDLRDQLVGHDDVELHLRQEIDHVLGAPVELGVTFLSAESFHLAHRDALNADRAQRFLHFVEFEGLDDRFDLLHLELLSGSACGERSDAPQCSGEAYVKGERLVKVMRVIRTGSTRRSFEVIEATDVPEKLVMRRGCEAVELISFEAMLPV
jgi:hypothetical protein